MTRRFKQGAALILTTCLVLGTSPVYAIDWLKPYPKIAAGSSSYQQQAFMLPLLAFTAFHFLGPDRKVNASGLMISVLGVVIPKFRRQNTEPKSCGRFVLASYLFGPEAKERSYKRRLKAEYKIQRKLIKAGLWREKVDDLTFSFANHYWEKDMRKTSREVAVLWLMSEAEVLRASKLGPGDTQLLKDRLAPGEFQKLKDGAIENLRDLQPTEAFIQEKYEQFERNPYSVIGRNDAGELVAFVITGLVSFEEVSEFSPTWDDVNHQHERDLRDKKLRKRMTDEWFTATTTEGRRAIILASANLLWELRKLKVVRQKGDVIVNPYSNPRGLPLYPNMPIKEYTSRVLAFVILQEVLLPLAAEGSLNIANLETAIDDALRKYAAKEIAEWASVNIKKTLLEFKQDKQDLPLPELLKRFQKEYGLRDPAAVFHMTLTKMIHAKIMLIIEGAFPKVSIQNPETGEIDLVDGTGRGIGYLLEYVIPESYFIAQDKEKEQARKMKKNATLKKSAPKARIQEAVKRAA